MAADLVGERVECGAESGDLVGETGDGAAVGRATVVRVDDGTDGWVAPAAARTHPTRLRRGFCTAAEPTGTTMSL
jgi:hypothetical protein